MHGFIRFMSSTAGRVLRVVMGLVLIIVGMTSLEGTTGIVVTVIGAVPLLAGVLDLCFFAPLFGLSIKGTDVRRNA